MEYNFVFFDADSEYYNIARYEADCLDNFKVRYCDLITDSKIKKLLYRVHSSTRLNWYFTLPFRCVWNSAYIGELDFPEQKPICFVFTVGVGKLPLQMKLLPYLRKTYPDCKLVLLLRDRVEVGQSLIRAIDLKTEAKKIFDLVYTINNQDAERYGFEKMHSFCSRYPVETSEEDAKSDLVFIGKVKDRLDTVRRAYEHFTAAGLKCDFLLIHPEPIDGLPEGLCVQQKGIPYSEMLRRTVNAKCILDVTQKAADGLTSRGLEALCYNKKLLTDNPRIKESKNFDPRFMQVYSDICQVDPAFIKEDVVVDYHYDGEFSPVRGLEKIEQDLKKRQKGSLEA